MQSNNLNILLISYGDDSFHENKSGVLERHINYSQFFNELFIIHLTKSKNLEVITKRKLIIKPIFQVNYFLAFFKALFFIIKIKRSKHFDVISTQDPFLTGLLGLFASNILKSKLHVQNHSVYINNRIWFKERPLLNPVLNFIGKKIIKNADRLRVVNSNEKEIYIKDLNINPNKIDIAPVPSNYKFWTFKYDKQKIQKLKDKYGFKGKLILGWAGRLAKFKRVDLLFEICSDLKRNGFKNFELLIAGDINKSEFNLEKLEEIFEIKPIYFGHLNHDELLEFYNIIDVYLHTSVYEGYGLVVKEAQLAGLPVVSFKTQGPSKLILEGLTGNLVENNIKSFSKVLSKYFENSYLKKMKKNTLINRTRFNENEETMNIIKSISKAVE